jgi:hypothetical protein
MGDGGFPRPRAVLVPISPCLCVSPPGPQSAVRMPSTGAFSQRSDDMDELLCRIDEIERNEPYSPVSQAS